MTRTEQLLTVNEVASRLSLGRTKIYYLLNKGEIPSIKIGNARRVPESLVDKFIARKLDAEGGSGAEVQA